MNRALAACRLNSAAVGLLESLTQEYMQQVERYAGERNRLLSFNLWLMALLRWQGRLMPLRLRSPWSWMRRSYLPIPASCCMMALLRDRMEILLDVCVDEQRKTSDEGFAQLLRDIKEDSYRSFVFYGGKWVEEVADDEDSEQAGEQEVDAESAAVLKILQILKKMQRLEEESESED